MRKFNIILGVLVIASMALSACTQPAETPAETPAEGPAVEVPTAETEVDTPLVVAYAEFSQKFSPFFGDTAYDIDVSNMTQINLLTTDRQGGIIFNAIEGETVNFNGVDYLYKGPADVKVEYDEASDTTKYTAKLREDMKFSDGEPVTADDIIFTYYTYLDPSYVGSITLSSFDIVGLKDYQTQTTTEVYDKYSALAEGIYAAGPDHVWAASDAWTEEQQTDFWKRLKDEWMMDVQGIIDEVNNSYPDYAADVMGMEYAEIAENEGLKVAFGMGLWGYGEMVDGQFVASPSGTAYDLVTTFPTVEDYYNETYAAYEGDAEAYASVESAKGTDVLENVYSGFIGFWGPQDESMAGAGVPNIAGIVKVDDYTVEVTVNGFSAPAVYQILGVDVTPLHYYGDVAKYDYENNMFGFDFGDLSKQLSLTATPMGAGA